jgi:hypothetical protein
MGALGMMWLWAAREGAVAHSALKQCIRGIHTPYADCYAKHLPTQLRSLQPPATWCFLVTQIAAGWAPVPSQHHVATMSCPC